MRRPSLSLEIVQDNGESIFFNLGPHPPRLWPEDIELVHQMWLELSQKDIGAKLHHRDVVGIALKRLKEELSSGRNEEVMAAVRRELEQSDRSIAGPERNETAGISSGRNHP